MQLWLMIVLRVIHIFSGVFWAGSVFFMLGFLAPTVDALGPDGGKFMQRLIGGTRLSTALASAAGLTALSGLIMYGIDFGSNLGAAISTGPGIVLTIGGLAGLVAAVIGGMVTGRTGARMIALGNEIQAAGGQPNPAQLDELKVLRERQANGLQWTAILLVIALLCMATARYL
jgi:uncharacterized membrane protein